MQDSWLHAEDMSREAKQKFATPYLDDGTKIDELLSTEMIGPAGSIVSSPTDMLKWLGAHMEQLELKSPLLDAKTTPSFCMQTLHFQCLISCLAHTRLVGGWSS